MALFEPAGNDLNGYRSYLRLLAVVHLVDRVQGRVDPSDIVQETLLEAHRSLESFSGVPLSSERGRGNRLFHFFARRSTLDGL